MSQEPSDPVRTLLSGFFPAELAIGYARRTAQLGGEALLVTLVSCWLPITLGLDEAGFVSLFLVAASLADRFSLLLAENRRAIWELRTGSRVANLRTAGSLLAIFCGIFVGYALVAAYMGESRVSEFFGFTIEAAGVGPDRVLSPRLGSVSSIFGHNFLVLVAILCLGFLYRAYGAVLSLSWNACVWAFVLSVLIERTMARGGDHPVVFLLAAAAAVLPHLLAEASAYIIGALAAIFASRGLSRYDLGDARLRRVLRAAAFLLVISLAVLAVAAALESHFAPMVLDALTDG